MGAKDNFLSNIATRDLVSSTIGNWTFDLNCGSKWRPHFWQICIQSVFVFENLKPLSVTRLLKSIQTKLQLTFSDTRFGRSVANLKIIHI